jgi:hypothetical protein
MHVLACMGSRLKLRRLRFRRGTDPMAVCNSWVAFDDIENEELEAAFSRGEDRVDFGSGR